MPFLREEDRVWGEIELLDVHIGVGEIGVDRGVRDQIRAQPEFDIDAAGIESSGSRS